MASGWASARIAEASNATLIGGNQSNVSLSNAGAVYVIDHH